jgi:hypothetical protein
MHIAYLTIGQVLSVEQLAELVGLKRRQIAYEARNGKIPGAIRPDGYHYEYRVTPELLDWIESKRRQVARRKHPSLRENRRTDTGVLTIHGMRQDFDIWKRRVGGLSGILKMDRECQQDILVELQAFARLHQDIYWALNPSQH